MTNELVGSREWEAAEAFVVATIDLTIQIDRLLIDRRMSSFF
jgi:hypothetical protein